MNKAPRTPAEIDARTPRFLQTLLNPYSPPDVLAGNVREEILRYQQSVDSLIRGPVQYHEAKLYLEWLDPTKAVR